MESVTYSISCCVSGRRLPAGIPSSFYLTLTFTIFAPRLLMI